MKLSIVIRFTTEKATWRNLRLVQRALRQRDHPWMTPLRMLPEILARCPATYNVKPFTMR